MQANRIHRFGSPEVISLEEVPTPVPGAGEVLVGVHASGVGPWDTWVRAGRSALPQTLPLTLGADLSGVVAAVGPGVSNVRVGDEVYGVTNPSFTGANAQFALASAGMITRKPHVIDFVAAASAPVIAVTAWQMLHEHARIGKGQTVLIHGAAGNVGAFAVQMAHTLGVEVIATARGPDAEDVRRLGADAVIDADAKSISSLEGAADAIIDTVGGPTQSVLLPALKRGGVLVSSVSQPASDQLGQREARGVFFIVNVTTQALDHVASMFAEGRLQTRVATVLPLGALREAHEMLEGIRPRPQGKIVLRA